jgi:hypothetical protein
MVTTQNYAEVIRLYPMIRLQTGKLIDDKNCPTQRAADKWDFARFLAVFNTSAESCSQAESTPTHLRLTQAVSPQSSTTQPQNRPVSLTSRVLFLVPPQRIQNE